jgi:hypothetical protein
MRSSLWFFLFLCSPLLNVSGADQPKYSQAEQEVLDAHSARTLASDQRDEVAWSRYVADDCIFSDDEGRVDSKAQLVAFLKKKLPLEYDHSVDPREMVIHVYGDTGVLNYRMTTHERFTDSDIISEMRVTETYIKQNGAWLLIARQWGIMPVNFRKPVTADASRYKDYVGQYVWRDTDDVETISVRDGRLWSRSGNDEDEYFPLGGDQFFLKVDLGSMTFVRDAKGMVTGYTYHRADGQEVHAKKIG